MSCFHPLKGFQVGFTKNGKAEMKIVPYGVHHLELRKGRICTSDVPEISAYAEKTWLDWVEIPCGKCEGCRIARSREWANRCMMELEYHDSAYFLTLTYDEEHVPRHWYADPETGEAMQSLSLEKRHMQLFWKRLRKAFPDDHIRYFMCGEYGSTTFRPHYHAIVFGLHLHDLVPVQDIQRGDVGYRYYYSEALQKAWSVVEQKGAYDTPCIRKPIGYVLVGQVNWETCAYVARYVLKKASGSDADVYQTFNIQPEYVDMSRRPGIGRQWYEDHPECMEYDTISISTPDGGRKIRPPKYFDKLFDLEQPDAMAEIKARRKHFAEEGKKAKLAQSTMTYEEILETQERVLHNRIKNLRREL